MERSRKELKRVKVENPSCQLLEAELDLGSGRQTPQHPHHTHPRRIKAARVISVVCNKQGLIHYVCMRHQEKSHTQSLHSNAI